MRKSVRRALRQTGEHLGVQVPVLGLVLRTEHAALGGAFEALLQFLRIDAAEEFLECGARRGERGGILRLEFAEVVCVSPRPIRRASTRWSATAPTPRRLPWKNSAAIPARRSAGAGMRKRLRNSLRLWFRSMRPEHRFAQQLAGELQRRAARLGLEMMRGSMPAPRQKAASPTSKSPSIQRRDLAEAPQVCRRRPLHLRLGGFDLQRPRHHVPGGCRRRLRLAHGRMRLASGCSDLAIGIARPDPGVASGTTDRWAQAAGSGRDPRPDRWRWTS